MITSILCRKISKSSPVVRVVTQFTGILESQNDNPNGRHTNADHGGIHIPVPIHPLLRRQPSAANKGAP
jgi:hypothetical protein